MTNDPCSRIRDDDHRQHVARLDKVCIGIKDLEASPTLRDEPGILYDLDIYARDIARAADFFARMREDGYR